jgi:hypothetical protein
LEKHSNETHTAITINKVEPTSLHTDWGCGISIQLLFQTRKDAEPIPSTTKAFFKASYADMFHYDAESHLREITAFYLVRIFKTNVVLPCIGYHLDPQQILVEDDKQWASIRENLECVNEKPSQLDASSDHGTATVEGSIMLWMYDLGQVDKEKIVESARRFNSSKHDVVIPQKYQDGLESTMNYAIFHYLGACMKSEHNHFSYRKKKRRNNSSVDGNFGRQYVATDNDRCVTPKAVFSIREIVPDLRFNWIQLWEKLVFERICQISHHRLPVLQVVRKAADSATKSGLISSHLLKVLKMMHYLTSLPSHNQRPFSKSMNGSTSLENIFGKTAHRKQHNITNL